MKQLTQRVASSANPKTRGMSRRALATRLGLGAGATQEQPFLGMGSQASTSQHTTIIVFLRGGADGLSMVAPMELPAGGGVAPDAFYEQERQTPPSVPPKPTPQLAIPIPGTGSNSIALTDSSGNPIPWMLSEGAAAAHPMYQNGDLAFIHGVGSPVVNNGSHFFSQDFIEDGTEVSVQASDGLGWAGRAMNKVVSTQSWRGMGYSKILQRTLFGAPKTVAIPDPTKLRPERGRELEGPAQVEPAVSLQRLR